MKADKVIQRKKKTLVYLNSEQGKINWAVNKSRGYTDLQNLIAAIQTAARLIKYESILEVLDQIRPIQIAA